MCHRWQYCETGNRAARRFSYQWQRFPITKTLNGDLGYCDAMRYTRRRPPARSPASAMIDEILSERKPPRTIERRRRGASAESKQSSFPSGNRSRPTTILPASDEWVCFELRCGVFTTRNGLDLLSQSQSQRNLPTALLERLCHSTLLHHRQRILLGR